MGIKTINRGKISVPNTTGSPVGQMALTKQASGTFEKRTLANRIYLATGKPKWNPNSGYEPVPRINGVFSGCGVTPGAANKVAVEGGVAYVNGVAVTVGANSALDAAAARPATGKYAISAVCVDAAGALSIIKGTDHTSYDFAGGYGGVGQKPLVATTLTVLRYFGCYDDESGVFESANFVAGEDANVGYDIDYLQGGIVLDKVLDANHTGPVERGVYCSFREFDSGLVPVREILDASLKLDDRELVSSTSNDSGFKDFKDISKPGWSVTINKHRENEFWLDKLTSLEGELVLLEMYEDDQDSYYWQGFAYIKSGGEILVAKTGMCKETLSFQGTRELRRVAV